jgi:hypothetical protein
MNTLTQWQIMSYAIISICCILGSVTAYWILTGTDAVSVDYKAYNNAKDNCTKLKQYMLDHYGDYNYDRAVARYGLMCK